MTESTITKFRWASRILTGLAGLAAILVAADWMGAQVHRWAALAVAVLGYGATWCAQQIPPPAKSARRPPTGPTAVMVILIMSITACNPYAAAWRSTAAVRSAGNFADDALEQEARRKHAHCLGKHGSKSPEYATCIKRHYGALMAWRNFARPAINSALRATVEGLSIAEKVRAKNKLDWVSLLKPAFCTLVKVTREWKDLFGEHRKQIDGYLALAQGVSCD